jgi:hypothetical protein
LISETVEGKEDAMKARWLTIATLCLLLVCPAVAQKLMDHESDDIRAV